MLQDKKEAPKQEKQTGRLEAFSDGVFAVAVTLLVFTVTAPSVDLVKQKGLGLALASQWPTYVAYAVSFFSVLLVWISHHHIFKYVQRANHIFILLNGLVLMEVSVLPFPTSLLAQYIQSNVDEQRIAVLVYSGLSLLLSSSITGLWWYASYNYRLLDKNTNLQMITATRHQLGTATLLYALSFGLAFINAYISIVIFLLLLCYFTLTGGIFDLSTKDE